jgi:hypothetical protein
VGVAIVADAKCTRKRLFLRLYTIAEEDAFNLDKGIFDDRPKFLLVLGVTSKVIRKRHWTLPSPLVLKAHCPSRCIGYPFRPNVLTSSSGTDGWHGTLRRYGRPVQRRYRAVRAPSVWIMDGIGGETSRGVRPSSPARHSRSRSCSSP